MPENVAKARVDQPLPRYTGAQVRMAGKRELTRIGVAEYGNPSGHTLFPHPGREWRLGVFI